MQRRTYSVSAMIVIGLQSRFSMWLSKSEVRCSCAGGCSLVSKADLENVFRCGKRKSWRLEKEGSPEI